VISLVVANEEETDQRKRRGPSTGFPSMLLSRGELVGAKEFKVGWKAAPERVIVPWNSDAVQIIPFFRVVLIVISAQSSR